MSWKNSDGGRKGHTKYFQQSLLKRAKFFHSAQMDLAFLTNRGKSYDKFFGGGGGDGFGVTLPASI